MPGWVRVLLALLVPAAVAAGKLYGGALVAAAPLSCNTHEARLLLADLLSERAKMQESGIPAIANVLPPEELRRDSLTNVTCRSQVVFSVGDPAVVFYRQERKPGGIATRAILGRQGEAVPDDLAARIVGTLANPPGSPMELTSIDALAATPPGAVAPAPVTPAPDATPPAAPAVTFPLDCRAPELVQAAFLELNDYNARQGLPPADSIAEPQQIRLVPARQLVCVAVANYTGTLGHSVLYAFTQSSAADPPRLETLQPQAPGRVYSERELRSIRERLGGGN